MIQKKSRRAASCWNVPRISSGVSAVPSSNCMQTPERDVFMSLLSVAHSRRHGILSKTVVYFGLLQRKLVLVVCGIRNSYCAGA
jgi:hypothetical protein